MIKVQHLGVISDKADKITLQTNLTQNCKNSSTDYKEWLNSKDFSSFLKSLKISLFFFCILSGTLLHILILILTTLF